MNKYDLAGKKINVFLDELGSSSVSPGGGAAAALTGALGASLLEMTARINSVREKKKLNKTGISKEASSRIRKFASIKKELSGIVRKDTEAFLALSAFPKEKRSGPGYDKALVRAAAAPLTICRLAAEALELGRAEVSRTGAWLASDLAEAGLLLEAAFYSGKLNVEINLKYIQDPETAASMRADVASMEAEVAGNAKELAGALKP